MVARPLSRAIALTTAPAAPRCPPTGTRREKLLQLQLKQHAAPTRLRTANLPLAFCGIVSDVRPLLNRLGDGRKIEAKVERK